MIIEESKHNPMVNIMGSREPSADARPVLGRLSKGISPVRLSGLTKIEESHHEFRDPPSRRTQVSRNEKLDFRQESFNPDTGLLEKHLEKHDTPSSSSNTSKPVGMTP
mmetsp:Transcript_4461/g.6621  ORF Transcript_4461/g.6621 Transcript_4461/m.6621 type:complete len:108 (+) Transcript_4461:2138-2461(+)